LQVTSSLALMGDGAASIYGNNTYENSGWKYTNSAYASMYVQNNGGIGAHAWYIAPSGTAGNAITWTQAMTLDASGNLEIGGTFAQGRRLNVDSSTDGYTVSLLQTSAFNSGKLAGTVYSGYYDGSSITDMASIRGGKENTTSGNFGGMLAFYTRPNGGSDTERMRIDSSGNVGIGTSSPSSRLEIVGTNPKITVNANDTINGRTATLSLISGTSGDPSSTCQIMYGASNSTSAGTLVFVEGDGTERARIDSSGNVGIGATSSLKKLTVKGSTADRTVEVIDDDSNDAAIMLQLSGAQEFTLGVDRTDNSFRIADSGALGTNDRLVIDSSGNVGIGTSSPSALTDIYDSASSSSKDLLHVRDYLGGGSDKTRLIIKNGGNVGIGTSSPARLVEIQGSSSNIAYLRLRENSSNTATNGGALLELFGTRSDNSVGYYGAILGGRTDNASNNNGYLAFYSGNTDALALVERARFDHNGNLLVGATGAAGGTIVIGNADATGTGLYVNLTTSAHYLQRFAVNSSVVGTITTNGTTTAYNTSSDYRLKEDIRPMTGALAKVAALKPCTYKWNADGSDGEGFIAHELAEVCPQAVTGEKDAVDEDGSPKYQGVDTSFLVATLTAAIQELKAELDSVKAELAVIKGA
jgi:hypothetical protein